MEKRSVDKVGEAELAVNVSGEHAKGALICPECGAGPYMRGPGLASHRRSAHSIEGAATVAARKLGRPRGRPSTNPSSLTYRPPDNSSNPQATDSLHSEAIVWAGKGQRPKTLKPNQCECGRMFNRPAELGRHMLGAHGVLSQAALVRREKKLAKTRALTKREEITAHGIIHSSSIAHTPAARQHAPTHATGAVDLSLVRAVGEVTGLCRAIAEQEGVPAVLFTARVAEFIFRSARGR